jgi:hypothetical protein
VQREKESERVREQKDREGERKEREREREQKERERAESKQASISEQVSSIACYDTYGTIDVCMSFFTDFTHQKACAR